MNCKPLLLARPLPTILLHARNGKAHTNDEVDAAGIKTLCEGAISVFTIGSHISRECCEFREGVDSTRMRSVLTADRQRFVASSAPPHY